MAEKPQQAGAVAVRIIEQAVAAANDGVCQRLIGKADARSPIPEIAIYAGAPVNAVPVGDPDDARVRVEVRDPIRNLYVRTEVLPAQADIESQFLADAPVVGKIEAILPAPLPRPGEREILFDESCVAQDETSHGISGRSGDRAAVVGEGRRKVEPAVAAIRL